MINIHVLVAEPNGTLAYALRLPQAPAIGASLAFRQESGGVRCFKVENVEWRFESDFHDIHSKTENWLIEAAGFPEPKFNVMLHVVEVNES